MLNTWDVRSGRNYKHAVWQDELNDAMASIGLDTSCITEEPPEMPVGSSLCAYSHNLWVNAVLQYQDEGTKLFDIVRPSLLISTDYAQMDLRAISEMKRGQVIILPRRVSSLRAPRRLAATRQCRRSCAPPHTPGRTR
jgi:hypothetical protein